MLAAWRALLVPPALAAKQALRLRRFGLGAATYALTAVLVGVAWAFGAIQAAAAAQVVAIYVAVNLAFYAAIRSGFNLRFADPSLTRLQIVAAITQVMFIAYHMDAGRDIALSGCFVVFLFGLFRLSAREFAGIALYTLAAYALVILLLLQWRPAAIPHGKEAWLGWFLLAGFLPVFAVIGSKIIRLRLRLGESESRFRSLAEMSSDLYWETDALHRISKRASSDPGVRDASIFRHGVAIGQRRWDVPSLVPDEAGWQAHREVLDARLPFRNLQVSRVAADGGERHVSISGEPVFDPDGVFLGYRGVGTDITERKRSEQALHDAAEDLRLFADNTPAMAVSWGPDLRYRFASRSFAEFYETRVSAIVGRHARDILGESVYAEVRGDLERALQGHSAHYRRKHTTAAGETRVVEAKLLPHFAAHGKVIGVFGLIVDITEHALAQERIQRVAHHDSLTGLPNRLLFDDRLEHAVRIAKRDARGFALLYLDLDRFKPVNDTRGHAVGDELLQAVALRIGALVRESDTVARVGGDEFAVILEGTSRHEEADVVAAKIAEALAVPFELGGCGLRVEIGASIGVALYPADGAGAEALVKAADAAMYGAKQSGNAPFPRAA
jgi:diguanylate cyclase (GGDEF)-like protein/PAS domain S-box-containing protein